MSAQENIDQLIAGLADWRGKVFAAVRRAVLAADPEIVEEWKWMGTPTWSCHGLVAVANAHKKTVKITFAYGAKFQDTHGLFNAGLEGNARRAIDFFEGDVVDEAALTGLVRRAIAFNRGKSKKK